MKRKSISLSLLIFISLLGFVLTGCNTTNNITLKKDKYIVEYGEKIKLDAAIYVDAKKEVLKKTVIDMDTEKEDFVSTNKDSEDTVLMIGTYKAKAKYANEELSFDIEVKDTTAPPFIDFKDYIEVEQGHSGNILDLFKAEDLSKVEISVKGEVDFNLVGEYRIEVIAIDEYNNKVTKKSTLIVKAKLENTESNKKTGNSSNSTGSTNHNGGSSHTGGSSSSNGSNGNTGGSSGGTSPTPPADVCGGYQGKFSTWDEANNYAYSLDEWKGVGFSIAGIDGCGYDIAWYDGSFN